MSCVLHRHATSTAEHVSFRRCSDLGANLGAPQALPEAPQTRRPNPLQQDGSTAASSSPTQQQPGQYTHQPRHQLLQLLRAPEHITKAANSTAKGLAALAVSPVDEARQRRVGFAQFLGHLLAPVEDGAVPAGAQHVLVQ